VPTLPFNVSLSGRVKPVIPAVALFFNRVGRISWMVGEPNIVGGRLLLSLVAPTKSVKGMKSGYVWVSPGSDEARQGLLVFYFNSSLFT